MLWNMIYLLVFSIFMLTLRAYKPPMRCITHPAQARAGYCFSKPPMRCITKLGNASDWTAFSKPPMRCITLNWLIVITFVIF